jgi:hypothetical protein
MVFYRLVKPFGNFSDFLDKKPTFTRFEVAVEKKVTPNARADMSHP